jgi:hypothetical protein
MAGRLTAWRAAIAHSRARYLSHHHRAARLFSPSRYTEKMQWRKLFDANPLIPMLSDKLAVRDYITARAGAAYLVPLLWSGTDIPFDALTPPYVLKSSHASGQVIMVPETPADRDAIRAQAASWLADDYGARQFEPGYSPVPRRLLAEAMLTLPDGAPPEEIRLFVFGGKVDVINTVFVEAGVVRNGAFHLPDWTRLDWHFTRKLDRDFPPPARLADMIAIAEKLGAGTDHVRVDIYDCGRQIHVGEITLYSWSGLAPFHSDSADLALGAFWPLPHPKLRAAATMLRRNHPIFSKG